MQITLRQYGVVVGRGVRTFRVITGEDHFTVPVTGTPLGTHQVIDAVSFVDMGCFNPDRFLCDVHASIHDNLVTAGDYLIVLHIILPNLYYPVTLIQLFAPVGCIVVDYICLAIFIKEKRGIDSAKIELLNIAPTLHGVFCFHNHVSNVTGKLSCDHVKCVIVLIVLDGRSIDPCTDAAVMHNQLRFPVEYMANLFPVYQIVGMENGYPREHGKGGGDKVIIISFSGDGGIRVTTLKDWIVKLVRF